MSAWPRALLVEALLTMVMIGAMAMKTMRGMMVRGKDPQTHLVIGKSFGPTRLLCPLLLLPTQMAGGEMTMRIPLPPLKVGKLSAKRRKRRDRPLPRTTKLSRKQRRSR